MDRNDKYVNLICDICQNKGLHKKRKNVQVMNSRFGKTSTENIYGHHENIICYYCHGGRNRHTSYWSS